MPLHIGICPLQAYAKDNDQGKPGWEVYWHIIFTQKYAILQAIRPTGMILEQDKPDEPNIKLKFGQYYQVY